MDSGYIDNNLNTLLPHCVGEPDLRKQDILKIIQEIHKSSAEHSKTEPILGFDVLPIFQNISFLLRGRDWLNMRELRRGSKMGWAHCIYIALEVDVAENVELFKHIFESFLQGRDWLNTRHCRRGSKMGWVHIHVQWTLHYIAQNESENVGHCSKQSNSILSQLCIPKTLVIFDLLRVGPKNMGSNYLKSCTFNI